VLSSPVGSVAALVRAKTASTQRSTALATDVAAAAPNGTKAVPVGKFAALTPGGRAAASGEAKTVPVEEVPAQKADGAVAAFVRSKTSCGDGSEVQLSLNCRIHTYQKSKST